MPYSPIPYQYIGKTIKRYVQDKDFRAAMDIASKTEIRGDRKEVRTAYTTK
jgi:hypothetical protein